MRKFLSIFVVLSVMLGAAYSAYACHIAFDPKEVRVKDDGTAVFTAWVKWEHRRCVLDDNDISVDYTKVKLIKSTGWVRVKRGLFKNTFQVKLEADATEGSVRVWRECSKKGLSEGTIKVKR